jgi:S1-C subfamily serine protease
VVLVGDISIAFLVLPRDDFLMNKILQSGLVAVGLVCLGIVCPAVAQDLADISEKAEKCVVRINIHTDDGDGHGSGFVVDDKGTIVTNCHVVAGATAAKVMFSDNTSYEVEGTYHIDPQRDIAVIMLKSPPSRAFLKVATQLPRKGETVTAIGAPHGLDFTVTRGIVSAIRTSEQMKQLGLDDHLGTWLQVDSAISSGNSGGPLLNNRGEVMGMSTMVLSVGQNLNFGISSVDIAEAIRIAKGKSVVLLADGAYKVKPPKSSRASKSTPVPKSAIDQYVGLGKKDFTKLVTKLKTDLLEQNKTLKSYKSGEVTGESITNNGRQLKAGYITKRSGDLEWLFASQKFKDEYVEAQTEICKQLKEVFQVAKAGMTDETLLLMLTKAGPELDPRKMKSVGFARDVTFLVGIDEVMSIVGYDGKPYLAELNSMAGMFPGEMLLPCAMYVKDTITMTGPDGAITATVLQQVPEADLQSAILGEAAPKKTEEPGTAATAGSGTEVSSTGGLGEDTDLFGGQSPKDREWTAKSGHKIRGALISKTATHVKIKRSDNQKVIEVKIDSLSDADKKFLGK